MYTKLRLRGAWDGAAMMIVRTLRAETETHKRILSKEKRMGNFA
jgi:hypothetical protein